MADNTITILDERDKDELESSINNLTAEDVGAVPANGGTMTGELFVKKDYPSVTLTSTNSGTSGEIAVGLHSTQIACRRSEDNDQNFRRLVLYGNDGHTLQNAVELQVTIDGQPSYYQLYGTHNKPTPAAIGAAPEYGVGTEKLTAGVSPLGSGHLFFVYK